MPVLRFSETDTVADPQEAESKSGDVEMTEEAPKQDQDKKKPQHTVFCFCMLDCSAQVDKAISGMDNLEVRDNQVLKASKVDCKEK